MMMMMMRHWTNPPASAPTQVEVLQTGIQVEVLQAPTQVEVLQAGTQVEVLQAPTQVEVLQTGIQIQKRCFQLVPR